MKKAIFILIAAFALSACFIAAPAMAMDEWNLPPVPVGSSPNQVGGPGWPFVSDKLATVLRADATNIGFFTHPAGAGPDFIGDTLDVTLPDGTTITITIDDIIATPGLEPERRIVVSPTEEVAKMLDTVLDESVSRAMSPAHGFCPEHLKFKRPGGTSVEWAFECDLFRQPRGLVEVYDMTDRQIVVGDVKKDTGGEFAALFTGTGADPLLNGVLGTGDARVLPYTVNTHPATVKANYNFAWMWKGIPAAPFPNPENVDDPYTSVISYGMADLPDTADGKPQGVVTAAYDTFNVLKYVKITRTKPTPEITIKDNYDMSVPADALVYKAFFNTHISPLISWRKSAEDGTVKLAGYSTWQLGSDEYDLSDWTPGCLKTRPISCRSFAMSFLKLVWKQFMALDLNPIDVVTLQSGGKTLVAVVSQSPYGGMDECIRGPLGICAGLAGGPHDLRDALAVGPSHAPFSMPHNAFSKVTFWELKEPWTGAKNPNAIFEPVSFAFIGANAVDADVLVDGTKQYLVVTTREPMGDTSAGGPGPKYYIYKIDPEQPNPATAVYAKNFATPPSFIQIPNAIAAEYFEATPPKGFVPHGISTADLDGNGCAEAIVTFSGRGIKPVAPPPFQNHDGETVYYYNDTLPSPLQIFSPTFIVYPARLDGSTCKFDTAARKSFSAPLDSPNRQITTAIAAELNGDGKLDILAGDLLPKQIPGEAKYAAYALAFYDPMDAVTGTLVDRYVRAGFQTTQVDPRAAAEGEYLLKVAQSDAERIAGVSKLSSSHGNIVAANGLPLMLPMFGCPTRANADIESIFEFYRSLAFNRRAHYAGIESMGMDSSGQIAPMRCAVMPAGLACADVVPPALQDCCCGKICAPFCESSVAICNEYRLLYPDIVTGGGYADFMDDGECNHSSALSGSDKNLFAEGPRGDGGGSDGGGGSDFADRADRVYDTKAPYIASIGQLKCAQTEENQNIANQNNQKMTNAARLPTPYLTNEETEALTQLLLGLVDDEEIVTALIDGFNSISPTSVEGQFVLPMIYILESLTYTPIVKPSSEVRSPSQPTSWLFKTIEKIESLGIVSEAHAGGIGAVYRFPRGQVMPGKREIDLILNATPIPPVTEITEGAADTKVITVKCMGDMDDSIKAHFKKFNEQMCSMVPGLTNANGECNDSLCLAELGYMHVEINSPGGAAPSTPAADLNSLSLSADMTGNIGQAAFAQYAGMKPFDFTTREMLPLKVDNVTTTMLLLPAAATAGGRAITVSPDLMTSASAIEPALLTNYMEASADPSLGTPSVSVLPAENKFTFNNVISWQTKAAEVSDVAKAAGVLGTAVNVFDIRLQPLLCSFTAVCEDSDAQKDENQYGKLSREGILKKAQENAAMCHDGVCQADFYRAIGIPPYQSDGFVLMQGKVAKTGMAMEPPDVVAFGFGGINVMAAQGGGCGCNVSALPPNMMSVIAMILVASLATTGFIVVRVRARRK